MELIIFISVFTVIVSLIGLWVWVDIYKHPEQAL